MKDYAMYSEEGDLEVTRLVNGFRGQLQNAASTFKRHWAEVQKWHPEVTDTVTSEILALEVAKAINEIIYPTIDEVRQS